MRKLLRWLGYALATLAALAVLFAAWIWFASSREIGRAYAAAPERLAQPSAAELADGERRARTLGCFGCHGEGLRGKIMIDAPPFATIWATNLTEVAARASDQQLARAIRQGIGADGHGLFVMPSPQYSRLSNAEVAVLVAVIRAQPRTGPATPRPAIGPIGRMVLATGGFRTAPRVVEDYRARHPWIGGPQLAAGRHLAATACAECHGPDLRGGEPMPDVIAPGLSTAGAYDLAQFQNLLRTGRAPHGRDLGLMRKVAQEDLSHLSDGEIQSLYEYLRARAERVTD